MIVDDLNMQLDRFARLGTRCRLEERGTTFKTLQGGYQCGQMIGFDD